MAPKKGRRSTRCSCRGAQYTQPWADVDGRWSTPPDGLLEALLPVLSCSQRVVAQLVSRAWYTAVRLGLHSCTPRRPGTSLPCIVALYPQLTRLDLSQQEGLSPACLAPLTQLTALQELSLPSLQAEGQAPPEVSSPRVRSDARQAAGRRPSPSTAQPVALSSHPGCTAGIFPPAVCAPPAQPHPPSHCSPLQVHAVEVPPPLPSQPGEGEQQAGWPQGSGGAPSCPSLPQPASASSSPQPGLLPLAAQGCSLPAPPLGPPLLALLSGVTRLQARLCPALCPAGLACLTQLASLELDSLGAVSALQPLTRLHSLSLARLSCSEGLGGLASLTALTSLALCTDSGQLGEFLRPLSGLTALQQLSLRSSSMAEPRQHMVMDWAPLSGLRCLALRVSCEALRGAAGPLAAALTQLTSLALELYTATEAEPALCLTTPPALQHLHLASDRSLQLDNCLSVLDCELYALTHLTALTDLTLAGCHLITDQGLAALQLLPRLRHLTLRGLHKLGLGAAQAYARRQPLARSAEDVSGRFLRALHPLRALRALALRNMDGLQEAELVRGLRQLTRLTRLEVREVAAMSDAVMQRAVVRLACLRDLSVTYCRAVTDKGRQAVLAALGLGLAMDLEGCSVQDPARPVALVTDSSQAQLREELGCASHQQAALAQAKARRAHRRLQASGQREAGGQPGTALTLAAGGGWEGEELSPCSSDASVGLA
ncbi:hypothetical protein V8C86DRAFT_1224390 [Haematococcus lacustris]